MSKEFVALEKMWNRLLHNEVDEAEKYFDFVVKALERNEPMKVEDIYVVKGIAVYDCPNCKCSIYLHHTYCPHCGQKLEWQVEE